MSDKNIGKVVQVIGPVLDIRFDDGHLPELLEQVMPDYLGGRLYSAACDSFASEISARRNAMDSATKNAGDMISDLRLKYNRARQGAITQEITEIVAGAEQ